MQRLHIAEDVRQWSGTAPMDDAPGIVMPDGAVLFQSVDIIAPTCNDPYLYGRIAAANAMSDLFARGAAPLCALHILALPPGKVSPEVAAQILQGGIDALAEAGAVSLGGHTLKEANVFYGLAVTGRGNPDRVVSMWGAQPGDRLVLTKPIGTGIVIEQLKKGRVSQADAQAVFQTMARLNQTAARAMVEVGAHAATDITGFGLAGHVFQLAQVSAVDIVIEFDRIPVYDVAETLFQAGLMTGASRKNIEHYGSSVVIERDADRDRVMAVVFDPQTSGGLIIALPEERVPPFEDAMAQSDQPAWVIGTVQPRRGDTSQVIIR